MNRIQKKAKTERGNKWKLYYPSLKRFGNVLRTWKHDGQLECDIKGRLTFFPAQPITEHTPGWDDYTGGSGTPLNPDYTVPAKLIFPKQSDN